VAPIVENAIGCIVTPPDGRRYIAHVQHDPMAEQPE
jgi:hypothetical protein